MIYFSIESFFSGGFQYIDRLSEERASKERTGAGGTSRPRILMRSSTGFFKTWLTLKNSLQVTN